MVLKDINLSVEEGRKLVVCGRTGRYDAHISEEYPLADDLTVGRVLLF